jgi:HK97 family phage major capsid protein
MLADGPALASYIDKRGTYGLKDKEDRGLLFGSGTGQELFGLVPQATAYSASYRKTGDTKIDTIRKAMLQVRKALYRADGIVMSADDWADIELAKDAGGNYTISNPSVNNGKNLWGLPVVESDIMPANSFLVGAFDVAAQIFDRQEVTVEVSTEHNDNFAKNMATVRIEERLALVTFRPASFVTGAFTV